MMDPRLQGIFREYSRFVFAICKRYAADHEEAEDLCQEVFLLVDAKLPGFRGESRMGTWIYRVAINRCLDHLRWKKGQKRMETAYLDILVLGNLAEKGDPVLAKIDLEKILSQTSERTRQMLFLSFAEGLTYQETGEVLGVEAATVAKTVQRFREKFQGQWGSPESRFAPEKEGL